MFLRSRGPQLRPISSQGIWFLKGAVFDSVFDMTPLLAHGSTRSELLVFMSLSSHGPRRVELVFLGPSAECWVPGAWCWIDLGKGPVLEGLIPPSGKSTIVLSENRIRFPWASGGFLERKTDAWKEWGRYP